MILLDIPLLGPHCIPLPQLEAGEYVTDIQPVNSPSLLVGEGAGGWGAHVARNH